MQPWRLQRQRLRIGSSDPPLLDEYKNTSAVAEINKAIHTANQIKCSVCILSQAANKRANSALHLNSESPRQAVEPPPRAAASAVTMAKALPVSRNGNARRQSQTSDVPVFSYGRVADCSSLRREEIGGGTACSQRSQTLPLSSFFLVLRLSFLRPTSVNAWPCQR